MKLTPSTIRELRRMPMWCKAESLSLRRLLRTGLVVRIAMYADHRGEYYELTIDGANEMRRVEERKRSYLSGRSDAIPPRPEEADIARMTESLADRCKQRIEACGDHPGPRFPTPEEERNRR